MSTLFYESFTIPAKLPVKSIEELAAIHTRAIKRLADLQVSIANLGIEGNVEQARLFSDTENYPGLVAAQSALAGSLGSRWLQISRTAADVVTETRDELNDWFRNNLNVAKIETRSAPKSGSTAKPARRAASRKAA
jgi:hypothetical protein